MLREKLNGLIGGLLNAECERELQRLIRRYVLASLRVTYSMRTRHMVARDALLRSLIAVTTFLMITLTALHVSADPTEVASNSADILGESSSGRGQADSRTGAMTWSYPFNLPAARGRIQAAPSLNYHSSSHDREAGYGWGFDLPTIERRPLSGYPCFTASGVPATCGQQDPKAPSEERYSYSGQPLMLVCSIPAAPAPASAACGDERHPDWARTGGWRYFRLEVEGQLAQFYLAEAPRYWRVQLKGGELLEFGEPPGTDGVERAADNPNAILRWRNSCAILTFCMPTVTARSITWNTAGGGWASGACCS